MTYIIEVNEDGTYTLILPDDSFKDFSTLNQLLGRLESVLREDGPQKDTLETLFTL